MKVVGKGIEAPCFVFISALRMVLDLARVFFLSLETMASDENTGQSISLCCAIIYKCVGRYLGRLCDLVCPSARSSNWSAVKNACFGVKGVGMVCSLS